MMLSLLGIEKNSRVLSKPLLPDRIQWLLCCAVRVLIAGVALQFLMVACTECARAQFSTSRGGWRTRWDLRDRNQWYSPVQYGASGYVYYPPFYGYGYSPYFQGGQTAYGNALREQASLTMAQGQATRNAAIAREYNEKARAQYIENQIRYEELRRVQREAFEARKAQEAEKEQAELAAKRERAASRTHTVVAELYSRLSVNELDPATGEIHWPKQLLKKPFAEGRAQIESAMRFIAQNGPNQRSATVIYETAKQMKAITNDLFDEMGFEAYHETRSFLNNLSVEGYRALEELK